MGFELEKEGYCSEGKLAEQRYGGSSPHGLHGGRPIGLRAFLASAGKGLQLPRVGVAGIWVLEKLLRESA